MTKLSELLERRSAAVAAMKAAEETGGEAFDKAKAEYDTVQPLIERAQLIDQAERQERGRQLTGDPKLTGELRSKFSIARLIAGHINPGSVDDGFEREMQGELAKRAGKAAQGLYIPMECFEKRVLTSSGDGAAIVPTDHRPDLYIDALTAATIVRTLGATVLTGLTGNVEIPREADSPNVGWVAQNAAISASDPDFDQVTLSPKHAGAITEYSRNMVMQSSPQIEALLRRMMARDLGIAIDRAAIKGGGTNEPVGVLATSGIQTQAYGTSLHSTTAEMIAKAHIANVDPACAFLTTHGVEKIAMKALDLQNQPVPMASIFHDKPTSFSNQVPANLGTGTDEFGLIYGDWSELLIGIWSEIDVLVNPYESTAYSKGNISIRAMATVDCALRHPAAFVSATGVDADSIALPAGA